MAKVLDKGFIELEEMMGGDPAVVNAARICYQTYQAKGGNDEADKHLINHLMAATPKHNTVFEHAVFRFRVKAPIFVARQWMRHRIGVFNEKSLRYCTANREFYIPMLPAAVDIGEYLTHMYNSFDVYESLLASGWKREQARGVLGTSVYTEFIWTVNAWSLMNWLLKRNNKSAQWEHRQYAMAALEIFGRVMPITAEAFERNVLAVSTIGN